MSRTALLSDIAEIVKDPYWPSSSEKLKYVGLEHINQYSLSLNGVGQSNNLESNKYRFKSGDILFGKLRPYFRKVYRPNFDGVCSTDIWVIRPKRKIDPDFLFYLIASEEFVSASSGASTGTRMPRADWNFASTMRWILPGSATQKQIGKTLRDLDRKIELNRSMSETLDQIGQAVFRHYFVDNPEAKSWPNGKLGDMFDIVMGQSPPGSTYNENGKGTLFFQGRAEFSERFPKHRLFTTEPKRLAKKGDVLLSVRAPAGDVNQATEHCCVGRGLAAISHKGELVSFGYYQLRTLQSKLTEYNARGTVFGAINSQELKTMTIKVPPFGMQKVFEESVKSLDNQIWGNARENGGLAILRDLLLPHLIYGKLK